MLRYKFSFSNVVFKFGCIFFGTLHVFIHAKLIQDDEFERSFNTFYIPYDFKNMTDHK